MSAFTNVAAGRWVALLAITFLGVATTSAQSPAAWCGSDALTVLPMGASITYGLLSSDGNGFRLGLQNLLDGAGNATSMAGTQWSGNMSDNHHEAYQGVTIDTFTNKSDHSGAYDYNANVLLIVIGTNDCWYIAANDTSAGENPRTAAGIEAATRFGNLLSSIKDRAPNALVLASELPRNTNEWCDRCIQGFNSQLPAVVQDAAAQGQNVVFVPMYDTVPADQIQSDGTHPTDYGYQLMAKQFYGAIQDATQEQCKVEVASSSSSSSSASRTSSSTASRTASSTTKSSSHSSTASSAASESASAAETTVPTAASGSSGTEQAASASSTAASAGARPEPPMPACSVLTFWLLFAFAGWMAYQA